MRDLTPSLQRSVGLLDSVDLLASDAQVGRYASLIAAPTEAQTNLLAEHKTDKRPPLQFAKPISPP
jgi:hypothetical protein